MRVASKPLNLGARLPGMADFTLKQGDLEPAVSKVLGLDLTGASVVFRMAPTLTRVETFSRAAVIVDVPTGAVKYVWQAGDTDVPGVFYGEFCIAFAGPRPQTVPGSGYLTIEVQPRL